MGCTCKADVHWPIDGSLRDGKGACNSISVFRINRGTYHDADLEGVTFAIFNFFPPKLSTGAWQMGLALEHSAADNQAAAVETIVRGVEGGPFAAAGYMVGDYMGSDRAWVRYDTGERSFGEVEGRGRFVFQPTLDISGKPVLASNAMFAFAEGYKIGRSQGNIHSFGKSFAVDYGEFGTFSFNDETTGVEREFRPSRITAVYGDVTTPRAPSAPH